MKIFASKRVICAVLHWGHATLRLFQVVIQVIQLKRSRQKSNGSNVAMGSEDVNSKHQGLATVWKNQRSQLGVVVMYLMLWKFDKSQATWVHACQAEAPGPWSLSTASRHEATRRTRHDFVGLENGQKSDNDETWLTWLMNINEQAWKAMR